MSATPKDKLAFVKVAAERCKSDLTQLLCRDANGKLTSITVHATGDDAVALERWLKRRAARP